MWVLFFWHWQLLPGYNMDARDCGCVYSFFLSSFHMRHPKYVIPSNISAFSTVFQRSNVLFFSIFLLHTVVHDDCFHFPRFFLLLIRLLSSASLSSLPPSVLPSPPSLEVAVSID